MILTRPDFLSLQRWRNELIQARLNGVRSVTDQNGERVEYKSDSEMAAALAYAEKLIADYHRPAPIKTIHISSSKGL